MADQPITVEVFDASGKLVATQQLLKDIGGGYVAPQAVVAGGASGSPVALASPPAATNAGSATVLHFASDINHLLITNNTTATVGAEWDGTSAGAGSYQIPASGGGLLLDVHIPAATGISLFTAAAQNINGATGSNIVVKGWG